MRWVGEEDLDHVAEVRWQAFGQAGKELARFKERIRLDQRAGAGDFLLAKQDGVGVGTATGLSMTMWVRGAPLPCQGVGYVGAIKTVRRRKHNAADGKGSGVASAVMMEVVRMARQREQVMTVLMPFRVSFYEHFGYGVVERRAVWTIPLNYLPSGDCSGWRLMNDNDRPRLMQYHQKMVEAGQCDVERPARAWDDYLNLLNENGTTFVDDASTAWVATSFVNRDGRYLIDAKEWSADSPQAFCRLLTFLGSLRDQYAAATIQLPDNWQVNRLLREPQLPHRPVHYDTSSKTVMTRMQLRILNHKRYLEAIRWPAGTRGSATVAVREVEGHVSRFSIEVEGGRATVKPSQAAADFECRDKDWAPIATGDLPASQAVRVGVASENTAGAAGLLDALAVGPLPFCTDYF